MRTSSILSGLVVAQTARGLNILMTNDDGFATSNIREMYHAMTALGHNCYIVASAYDQSAQGGRVVFTDKANLTTDSEWGVIKAGAPSIGRDPNDDHIWYYDGTPSAQVYVALDYVLPTFANFSTPDLVMTGPNYGLNTGPFLYTFSGTMGATYSAVYRGIPAIAFAGALGTQAPYYWTNASTPAGLQDPATIMGRLAAALAQAFIDKARTAGGNSGGGRILPLGYGISVNMPRISSFADDSCLNPPFVLTRMTGAASVDHAVFDPATGLISSSNINAPGLNTCINGDCTLPAEDHVLASGCSSSVSVFTVDYDAPGANNTNTNTLDPYALLPSLVQLANSSSPATPLIGGLGPNATFAGHPVAAGATASPTASGANPAAKSAAWSVRTPPTSVLAVLLAVLVTLE